MQERKKDSFYKAGIRILQTCKNELYLSMRFLDLALNSLDYRMDMGSFFMGTDGGSLYFQPRFLAERYAWQPIQVNRAYLHSVLHCVFHHPFFATQQADAPFKDDLAPGRQTGGEDALRLWNLSCDIAVEYVIDHLEQSVVAWMISPEREACYQELEQELSVLSAQAVYHFLCRKRMPLKEGEEQEGVLAEQTAHALSASDLDKLETAFLVDDHRFWKGKTQEEKEQEKGKEREGEDERGSREEKNPSLRQQLEKRQQKEKMQKLAGHWQRISEKTRLHIEAEGKDKVPVHLLQQMDIENRERISYKQFLLKFAARKEKLRIDTASFDTAFYCYGLQAYERLLLVEPLEYKECKEIEEFVIVIDTSASCSGKLVRDFLEETCKILLEPQLFAGKSQIHILQCDDSVQEDICLSNVKQWQEYKKDFQIKGLVQTDFREAFAYVERLRQQGALKKLRGLLYFTDGYGIYPKKRPDYDTVFVFMDRDYNDKDVPPWAMRLVLPELVENI